MFVPSLEQQDTGHNSMECCTTVLGACNVELALFSSEACSNGGGALFPNLTTGCKEKYTCTPIHNRLGMLLYISHRVQK